MTSKIQDTIKVKISISLIYRCVHYTRRTVLLHTHKHAGDASSYYHRIAFMTSLSRTASLASFYCAVRGRRRLT